MEFRAITSVALDKKVTMTRFEKQFGGKSFQQASPLIAWYAKFHSMVRAVSKAIDNQELVSETSIGTGIIQQIEQVLKAAIPTSPLDKMKNRLSAMEKALEKKERGERQERKEGKDDSSDDHPMASASMNLKKGHKHKTEKEPDDRNSKRHKKDRS